jgi:uncharacterized membrane protein
MRFGRVLYIVIILVCVLEGFRLWTVAPDQMAAHFNALGMADRYAPKIEFFTSQLKVMLAVLGISVLTEVLLLVTPATAINMPNKEYWMAPERRDIVMDRISSTMSLTFASVLLVLFVGLELSVRANLQQPAVFPFQVMLVVIAVVFISNMIIITGLARSFKLPLTTHD